MANLCYLQNGGLIDRHCLVTEKGVALCIRDAIGYQDIKNSIKYDFLRNIITLGMALIRDAIGYQDIKNSIKYDFLRNIITLGMAARSAHLGHKGGW